MRDEEVAKEINNTNINSRYLPNLTLGSNLIATSEMADISDSGIIIFVFQVMLSGMCLV